MPINTSHKKKKYGNFLQILWILGTLKIDMNIAVAAHKDDLEANGWKLHILIILTFFTNTSTMHSKVQSEHVGYLWLTSMCMSSFQERCPKCCENLVHRLALLQCGPLAPQALLPCSHILIICTAIQDPPPVILHIFHCSLLSCS